MNAVERRARNGRRSSSSGRTFEADLEFSLGRILVTGATSALGRAVIAQLALDGRVGEVLGMDIERPDDVPGAEPIPMRMVSGGDLRFVALDPRDRRVVSIAVNKFAPTAVLHLGIYEPDARMTPRVANQRTRAGTYTVLGAASEAGALRRIVVRSGIEVYGRRRGAPHTPDEGCTPDPTTPFGIELLRVEQVAEATGESVGVPVTVLRFAPIVGPTLRSPMQRFFQLPAIPVSALSDPQFSLFHVNDAAGALVAALAGKHRGPVNCIAPGVVTVFQVLRQDHKLPIPVFGPQWWATRRLSSLVGSPVPDHLLELLQRGRTADGSAAANLIDWHAKLSASEVAQGLSSWSTARVPRRPVKAA